MPKKSLFILPFDHRSSFVKKMFNISGRDLTNEELESVKELKQIIYQGFEMAIKNGEIPRESAAILIDEHFGDAIIKDAVLKGYAVCLSTEKSGQDEFDFEYGESFGEHINKYKPAFAKALVRYNPEGDKDLNFRQREKLKKLSDFCKNNNCGFLIEPLVPATKEQLKEAGGDQNRYDNEFRPKLMIEMIKELHNDKIEPDVWKIEGLENPKDYQNLVAEIKSEGRNNADAIVLGRGADALQVEKWLLAGAKVEGIIGFAIGRTIFWDSLVSFKEGKIGEEEAALQIGKKYSHFYQVFTGR